LLGVACVGLFVLLIAASATGEKEYQSVEKSLERNFREAGKRLKSKATNGRKKSGVKRKAKKKGNRRNFRKNKKQTRKSGKQPVPQDCSRQATSTFCPTEKATALKIRYNQVANFEKQLTRAVNQAKIVKLKKKKKDNFQKDAAILTDVVGGNLTKPTCNAKSRSADNAASQGNVLSSCSKDIETSCKEVTVSSNLTGACSDTMDAFKKKVETCKDGDSCTCWTEAVAMKSDVSKCLTEMSTVKDDVKKKKTTCLKTFGNCKKAQDKAVEFTSTCPSKETKPPGSVTTKAMMASKRKSLVEKILASNLIRHS